MPHSNIPEAHRKNARRMRRVLTAAELKFWNAVRAHRLMGIGFRRQMPIAGYIVDFACSEHRLIVEIDGPSHSYDQSLPATFVVTKGWLQADCRSCGLPMKRPFRSEEHMYEIQSLMPTSYAVC